VETRYPVSEASLPQRARSGGVPRAIARRSSDETPARPVELAPEAASTTALAPAEPNAAAGDLDRVPETPEGPAAIGAEGGTGSAPMTVALGSPDQPMFVTLGSTDPRYSDYLGRIAALLEPEWRDAFPRERAMYMQQGEIVLEWTIDRQGGVRDFRVVRASRVPVFDRNVVAGFRRAAARFPAPPATVPMPLRIRAPFRFDNPMFE